jgi:xylulokinase
MTLPDLSPERPILALDCGSTNFKAALFTRDLHRIAEASAPLPYLAEEPDRTELDPHAVWECARSVLAETLRQGGLLPRHRPLLALTSQAQTFALFDGESLASLSPFISWRDGRARAETEEIQKLMGDRFAAETGFPDCIPYLLAPKLLAVLRHLTPRHRSTASIMSLPGFIAWKWAGLNAIDPNLAAMSGLFSIPAHAWNPKLLRLLDLRPAQLPKLVPLGQPQAGPIASAESGPDPEIVFSGNDQTAGAFGNDCDSDHPLITLGTALVAYRLASGQPGPYPGKGIWGPYPGNRYYELVSSNYGCAALDWACRQRSPDNPKAILYTAESWLAAHPHPQSQYPFFFPHLSGSPRAWNISLNPIADLCAVTEGIAFELKRLMELHFPPLLSTAHLRICGGGSRSDAWLQLIASLFNRPVIRASGDALLGAARMTSLVPLPPPPTNPLFLPDPISHPIYTDRYVKWASLRSET